MGARQVGIQVQGPAKFLLSDFKLSLLEIAAAKLKVGRRIACVESRGLTQ